MGTTDSKYNAEGDKISDNDEVQSIISSNMNDNKKSYDYNYSQGFEDGVKYALQMLEQDIKKYKF